MMVMVWKLVGLGRY